MITLWFIVVLIAPQCAVEMKVDKEQKAKENPLIIMTTKSGPVLRLPTDLHLGLEAAHGDAGVAAAVFSREYPKFSVEYDTRCYTVSVSSMPMSDWRPK